MTHSASRQIPLCRRMLRLNPRLILLLAVRRSYLSAITDSLVVNKPIHSRQNNQIQNLQNCYTTPNKNTVKTTFRDWSFSSPFVHVASYRNNFLIKGNFRNKFFSHRLLPKAGRSFQTRVTGRI